MSPCILGLFMTLIASAPSGGEDAEALMKRGVELRRTGQDLEALELFERANHVSPSPRALAQIGMAEQALGRWPEAAAHIEQAVASPKDPWIAKNRAALDESLATIALHLGALEILGSPSGAEVVLDGRVVTRLPMAQPLRVAAGTVPVEVRAKGYLPLVRTVSVVPGQLTRESVTLQAVPVALDASPPSPSLPPSQQDRGPASAAHLAAPSSRSAIRTTAWVTLGVGTASAVVGAVSLIVRETDATNYNANCVTPPVPLDMDKQAQCRDWRSGGDTAAKVAAGTLAAAGVLGAASAVLFYVSRPPRPSRSTDVNEGTVGLICLPGLVSVSCAMRF
jgi:hypothetical protein